MTSKKHDSCVASNLPEVAPAQLRHTYLESGIPGPILSGFSSSLLSKAPKNNASPVPGEPQKWIAQANKISAQQPNKACKLYLDAAKELAAQHNISTASQALHSLLPISSATRITARAHLLLARLLRLFDIVDSSHHYEECTKLYFSLTPCTPPPIPSLSSLSVSSAPQSAPSTSSVSSPSRDHPPVPSRASLLRDTRAWAGTVAQEIAQKDASHDDAASTSDDESGGTKKAQPTTSEQVKTALECVVEISKYSQDTLYAALACDVCGACEEAGLLAKLNIPSDINWSAKAAEKYASMGIQSHAIDALVAVYQHEKSNISILLKALSKAVMIDDRVRVQKILTLLASHENAEDTQQCLMEIGRAHVDSDSTMLAAISSKWRGVLATHEDASDAWTCATYHLS